MRRKLKILFVDDEPSDVSVEQFELERHGLDFASRIAASDIQLKHELSEFEPDVILCDYTMKGFSGLLALETARQMRPATPVIMVSGSIAEDTAIECLECGATDYLLKSNLRRLGPAVCRAVAESSRCKALEERINQLLQVRIHSGEDNSRNDVRCQLANDLRIAIDARELSMYYQPQFEIDSGRVCGVEALARWFRADGETIPPSVFIPLAEQAGLIGSLGIWALRTGCAAVASWPSLRARPPICINVSAQQIRSEFTDEIITALEASGLPAERLELEITESVLVENADLAIDCLKQWKRLGVRLAVDDFGTGYSNLGYLSRLPIDRLKIDRSLVPVTLDSRETTIVRAVISLGRELGFTVLAEGVETEEQLHLLSGLGCHQAQGFLLTPPTMPGRARELMNRRWGSRSPGVALPAADRATSIMPGQSRPSATTELRGD